VIVAVSEHACRGVVAKVHCRLLATLAT
jgi:hypothetical protein